MLDVIMFIPNTLPILLHKNLGRGTQFKLSIPTLICRRDARVLLHSYVCTVNTTRCYHTDRFVGGLRNVYGNSSIRP